MRPEPPAAKRVLTFAEDFAPGWAPGPASRWKTNYYFGDQKGVTSRMIPGERQAYVEAGFKGRPETPFWVSASADNPYLMITAQPASPAQQTAYKDPTYPAYSPTWASGLITTEDSFVQRYGFFEFEAQFPIGAGAWPAFWLLPADEPGRGKLTEIDIVEGGAKADSIVGSVHWFDKAGVAKQINTFKTGIDTTGWHRYGLLWSADKITWFFDGQPYAETANPGVHIPHYLLINLAVGNDAWSFIGAPDPTGAKLQMRIRKVRAYRILP